MLASARRDPQRGCERVGHHSPQPVARWNLAQIPREQLAGLTAAIQSHDYLDRVVREIEELHRVVFHANERVDWSLVRRSAEQILITEIVGRHRGQIEGVFFALRAMENGGKSWEAAIRELAASMHSYYTTPLGIVMRQDLFGTDVVFITPDAYVWTDRLRGRQEAGQPETP